MRIVKTIVIFLSLVISAVTNAEEKLVIEEANPLKLIGPKFPSEWTDAQRTAMAICFAFVQYEHIGSALAQGWKWNPTRMFNGNNHKQYTMIARPDKNIDEDIHLFGSRVNYPNQTVMFCSAFDLNNGEKFHAKYIESLGWDGELLIDDNGNQTGTWHVKAPLGDISVFIASDDKKTAFNVVRNIAN